MDRSLVKIRIYNIFRNSPARVIVLGFALLILTGTLLLMLPAAAAGGRSSGFVAALFTATSSVCVTGLVVVDTGTHWSDFGKTVILLLIQTGGLGIMSVTTLFFMVAGKNIGLKERLALQESLNKLSLSGVVRMLKHILILTAAIEVAGAVLLSTRLIPAYGLGRGIAKSLFHSVSAFCNAGFDTLGTEGSEFGSLIALNSDAVVLLTICGLIISGGLGFVVWWEILSRRRPRSYTVHTRLVLVLTSVLVVFGTVFLLASEFSNPATLKDMPFSSKLLNAFFHSVTPRTAGFNSLPIAGMTEVSKFFTILLMFIGAAPGSTAGGIKVTTACVLLFTTISSIKGEGEVHIMKRRIPALTVTKALAVAVTGFLLVIVTTFVLIADNDVTLMEALYESVSAFGTVGLSTGITPELGTASLYQLVLTMFMGRVGPLSAIMAITIRQNGRKMLYKYPEGKIIVG